MQVTPLHILLLGIVVYVAYRIISASKKTGKDNRPQPMAPPREEEKKKQALDAYKNAENTWDLLRSKPKTPAAADQSTVQDTTHIPTVREAISPDTGAEHLNLPQDFDLEEFLAGATAMYARIKESWYDRDMEDLRQFTTPEFFEELKRRAGEETRPAKPEIPPVKARLVELSSQGNKTLATVFYEAAPAGRSSPQPQAREVWRFVREDTVPASSWRLENIQQVQ